jgi:sugar lactone lactonase YvrE
MLLSAVTLAVSICAPSLAQDSGNLPVGTIVNFGPDLQTVAGGVCRRPEGIALDPEGNLYLASNSDAATTVGHVCVLDPRGNLIDIIDVPSVTGVSAIGLVGELWGGDYLFVCDYDNVPPHGRVLTINPRTHEVTTHFSGLAFPNGFPEDQRGNFYVADSLLGRIYKFTSEPDSDTVWFEDSALLSTNPNQNVGANDLAFDVDENFLYVTNAGNRQVLRIPLSRDGAPAGPIQVFADGPTLDQQLGLPNPTALYSADGLQFDMKGNLYVMSNQTDEIEVFSPGGALTKRYSATGANAMSFNASPIFKGSQMYITNMSATDGGVNSKVSLFQAPFPGLQLY